MEKIKSDLKKVIFEAFDLEVDVNLMTAPAETGADVATNVAMMLAGRLRRKPIEIAEELVKRLEVESGDDYKIEVAMPGFLNFTVSDQYFLEKLAKIGDKRIDFKQEFGLSIYDNKQVVTEFSDPNPFKVLHVGHLYDSVVGEAISNLFELFGAKVHRTNFGGDVGMHVAKTMFVMMQKQAEMEEIRSKGPAEKAEFMARCYVEGTGFFEEVDEKKAQITALNKEIYELVDADNHESELAKVYWEARTWSYDYFEDFYAKIGVKFEKYYPESAVVGKGLEVVKQGLKDGVYEESDGAVVFKGDKYGLHTRVFINNAGLPTYEAKDIGLSFTKWKDYEFDESVIITGNDITDYMKVVLKSMSMINSTLVERTVHLTHGNVRLPGNEKMSSRKGNFLKALDILDIVRGVLKEKYGDIDEKVVMAAIKYAFLKYKIGGNIIFDAEDSVSMTGNSGPYLQYATVRAKKILEKCSTCDNIDNMLLQLTNWKINDNERNLMKKIEQYGGVLNGAMAEKAPHKICTYLYELAQEFSRFYEKVPVVGSEKEGERMVLLGAYARVMEHGLNLIGIEVPEEM